MLDINKIRENKKEIEKALLKRMEKASFNLDEILKLDDKRRVLIKRIDKIKEIRNKKSKTKPSAQVIKEMRIMGDEIKEKDSKLKNIESILNQKLSELPNVPADDVAPGGKENNRIIHQYGEQPKFDFKPKDHVKLATSLGLIDYERAAKMSGSGFWCYTGDGALLEWALLNYFIEFHKKNNYTFIIPPFLLNEASAYASGHLPKFRGDLFWAEKDKLCLNATSEMMLLNYHRNEILSAKNLPKKYFAFSTCFRREAGAYRTEERGMLRGHQFNKIEMFQFTHPKKSWSAFDELVKNAEKLVEGLGLHYQTVLLAAGDASDSMAKTIDIEVYIPSIKMFKEVSSVSNALDYQARRGNIRFTLHHKGAPHHKGAGRASRNEFVHTLNASGLATSRLIPAILEQFQQEDGSVVVPEVLQTFVGKEVIKK